MVRTPAKPVVILGAGPYGLAAAAHLRHCGVETRVFGKAMQFWHKQMPAGMRLRSRIRSSHIADPKRALKLTDFARSTGSTLPDALPLCQFIGYGEWFQSQVIPDLDTRQVMLVECENGGFKLTIEDGEVIEAARVVVAAGLSSFPRRPALFDSLPAALVSHSSEHADLSELRGQNVLVIGAGQSALECAALLSETGAAVEVLARSANIRWLGEATPGSRLNRSRSPLPLLDSPPTDVGGNVVGWIVAAPDLYRRVPARLKPHLATRPIRPAGASWLRARLADVPITTARTVVAASVIGRQVQVQLDDRTERRVDHVLLATGYCVDVARYGFLSPTIMRSLQVIDGYPRLGPGLESSVAGLHFLGAPAAMTFGPIMRFVVGTWYAAPALTRRVLGRRQPLLSWSIA